MERKDFLNKLTGGLALTCVACMMEACSKDNEGSDNNPGTALLTLNLNSQLLAVGDYISENGVVIARLASGNAVSSFAAFSNVCPHQGQQVVYQKSSSNFFCSTHSSSFSQDGARTGGPATTGLARKTVAITGSTLTVR
ncbi:MAG: Rieske 2Fe-2S domain-containing protein [Bacteroidetes bacterium]|nr:Rieske 2Fe-2S domain-containing protein [Bacteroidota bacterium]